MKGGTVRTNARTHVETQHLGVQNITGGEENGGAENWDLKHPMEFVFLQTPPTAGRCLECLHGRTLLRRPHGKTHHIFFCPLVSHVSTECTFYQVKRGERSVRSEITSVSWADVSPQDDCRLDSTKLLFELQCFNEPNQYILQRDTWLVLLHSTSSFLRLFRPNKTTVTICIWYLHNTGHKVSSGSSSTGIVTSGWARAHGGERFKGLPRWRSNHSFTSPFFL